MYECIVGLALTKGGFRRWIRVNLSVGLSEARPQWVCQEEIVLLAGEDTCDTRRVTVPPFPRHLPRNRVRFPPPFSCPLTIHFTAPPKCFAPSLIPGGWHRRLGETYFSEKLRLISSLINTQPRDPLEKTNKPSNVFCSAQSQFIIREIYFRPYSESSS